MKQISIVLTFFFVAFSINGYAQTDTTLKKILLINLTSYKQKPVDSLFKKLPTNYTKTTVFGSRRSSYGNSLVVMYPNDVSVWIVVGTFKYFNPHLDFSKPLKGQWDANIPLFKKERMAYAIVYQGNTCYGGCENDIKSQWERKIKH